MAQPKYISWTGHGSSCGEPPGVFTGGHMHLFGIAADRKATQALADKFLNPVASIGLRYTSFLDSALVTFLDIERCTTPVEVIGWVPGRECALWIPLVETRLSPFPHTRVVMWSPYIFIDYGVGMATGREVWGWSKALGDIDVPAAAAAAPVEFKLSTLIFDVFNATLPGREGVLLKITGTAPLNTTSTWADEREAARNIIAQLTGTPVAAVPDPFDLIPVFPAIALKQFRDSAMPDLACFQALVNSPVQITKFSGGGLDAGTFSVEVTTCASHPIVQNFLNVTPGAATTVLPAQWAAWIAFDFQALPGTVIARTI